MNPGVSGQVVLLAVGLVLAALAAAAETALTSVSRIRMRTLAETGDRRARVVVRLHNDPNGYLSTILSINTVAVILASTAAAVIQVRSYRNVPEAIGTAVLSVVVLVFCEIAPKSLALRFNERVALIFASPVALITRVLRPVVGALTFVSRLLLRIATRGRNVPKPFVTEEELKMLVAVGEQDGVVEQEERQMINGILEMTDKAVREVMIPRVDVIGIEHDRTIGELIKLVIDHGHSRIPVYEETLDNVVGVVYAKDLLRQEVRADSSQSLRALAREAYFTPEAKRLGELLHEMQERTVHIAMVVDEYGGTAGIVTIEDLIEEIVGPIRDEYDIAEPEDMQFLSDSEVLLNARVPIDDVAQLLHLDLGDEVDSDSIGGLVYERLGEIPKAGATLALGTATLTVEAVRRQSIQSVRILSPTPFLRETNGRREEFDARSGEAEPRAESSQG
ncbi:MAG: hemolysin family protein [Candidatus Dormibacteria bacterium]